MSPTTGPAGGSRRAARHALYRGHARQVGGRYGVPVDGIDRVVRQGVRGQVEAAHNMVGDVFPTATRRHPAVAYFVYHTLLRVARMSQAPARWSCQEASPRNFQRAPGIVWRNSIAEHRAGVIEISPIGAKRK